MMFLEPYKKYVDFSGRARRKEYWLFILFYCVVAFILVILDMELGLTNSESGYGVLSGLFGFGSLIPYLAVSVRRLHDINRTGWWLLIWIVPVIGVILLIVWNCFDSDAADNRFGENPKL